MITLEKLKIYKRFNGDGDMWTRLDDKKATAMTDADWNLIDSLIQDLELIHAGYASENYIANTNKTMSENFVDNNAVVFLRSLIKQ